MKSVAAVLIASAAVAVILALEDPTPAPTEAPKPYYYGQYGEECLEACPKNLEPVCAQNPEGKNRTYPNLCYVRYLNCKEKNYYEVKSNGACYDDPLKSQDDGDLFARFDV